MAEPGEKVRIREDASLEERRFRGRTGTYVETTKTHGYARVKMDDPTGVVAKDGTLLVHPESLEVVGE
jgi:ribosomal protein L21E